MENLSVITEKVDKQFRRGWNRKEILEKKKEKKLVLKETDEKKGY